MANAILLAGDSTTDANLYYRTGFVGEGFIYLEIDGQGTLIASGMEQGRARKESSATHVALLDDFGYREAMASTGDRNSAFATVMARAAAELGASRVTVGPRFPALWADSLRAAGLDLEIDPQLLVLLRRQKTPEQIEAIARSQASAGRGAARAVDVLREAKDHDGTLYWHDQVLTSERLRTEMDLVMTRDNMDTSRVATVAGGQGAADPHWFGYGPLRSGQSIVMDIVPRDKDTRYYGDMTRTVVVGEPPPELQRMYDVVIQAHAAALREIRAGASGRDAHRAVQETFWAANYDTPDSPTRYIHSTGHGVGLDIHEAPSLGTVDVKLLENDVVSVEPGLYNPELGAVRVEDLVAVTPSGYRNLTSFPKDFRI